MVREIARLIDGAVLKVSCVVTVDPLVFPPEPIVESLIEPMTLVNAMTGDRLPVGANELQPASRHHSPNQNIPYLVRRSRRSWRGRS